MHGKGVWSHLEGDRYEGFFENDKKHGQGTYKYSDGSTYEGSFENGLFHGRGIYTWPEGHVYVGDYENNKREGNGKMIYSDGLVVDGIWRNDCFSSNSCENKGGAQQIPMLSLSSSSSCKDLNNSIDSSQFTESLKLPSLSESKLSNTSQLSRTVETEPRSDCNNISFSDNSSGSNRSSSSSDSDCKTYMGILMKRQMRQPKEVGLSEALLPQLINAATQTDALTAEKTDLFLLPQISIGQTTTATTTTTPTTTTPTPTTTTTPTPLTWGGYYSDDDI